jgi:cell division protein FtsI (penicillin-binding protein 3)/stage V sporulation protein D (sporulation-specific penicillin-binding protein)
LSARVANRRIRLLLAIFVLAFGVAFLRAAWLQGVRAASFGRLASNQHSEEVTIPAARGTLYDWGGVQLAIGEQATTVYADPRRVADPRSEATTVARILRLDSNEVYTTLADRTRGFVYVARKANPALAARLARKGLPGLGFYPEERRFYPQFNLGAQVLGYAGVDNRGLAGLELSLDRQLAGRPGRERVVKDASGQAIDTITSRTERDGEDVYLTLDHTIQSNAQAVLRDTVRKWHAKSATAIVLDPATGAVRAMAVAPGFDANVYPKVWRVLQRNRAVTDTYEPGSTFKLVTVAGALSNRLVSPTTRFTLPYEIHVADRVIHDAEPRGTETMTVAHILSHSSNVGAITLAQKLGRHRLVQWISRFGFGKLTGIDFPGESAGIVLPEKHWSGSSIGNIPIGQGIAVTPIQMASAYAAIANRGLWVQPHLVDHIGDGRSKAPRQRRVVSRWVATQLMSMLKNVVAEGTGTLAEVPGYQVAGKTGTAAKPDEHGGYSDSRYVASFVGVVPASRPRLVILVSVDEPQGAIWGGLVAAPAFSQIAKFDLQYLDGGIRPDAAPSSPEYGSPGLLPEASISRRRTRVCHVRVTKLLHLGGFEPPERRRHG